MTTLEIGIEKSTSVEPMLHETPQSQHTTKEEVIDILLENIIDVSDENKT